MVWGSDVSLKLTVPGPLTLRHSIISGWGPWSGSDAAPGNVTEHAGGVQATCMEAGPAFTDGHRLPGNVVSMVTNNPADRALMLLAVSIAWAVMTCMPFLKGLVVTL
jgi:hypothetical protein